MTKLKLKQVGNEKVLSGYNTSESEISQYLLDADLVDLVGCCWFLRESLFTPASPNFQLDFHEYTLELVDSVGCIFENSNKFKCNKCHLADIA